MYAIPTPHRFIDLANQNLHTINHFSVNEHQQEEIPGRSDTLLLQQC